MVWVPLLSSPDDFSIVLGIQISAVFFSNSKVHTRKDIDIMW